MSGVGELSCEGGRLVLLGVPSPMGLTGVVRGEGASPAPDLSAVVLMVGLLRDESPLAALNTFRFNFLTLGYFLGFRKSSELSSLGSSSPLKSQCLSFLKKYNTKNYNT